MMLSALQSNPLISSLGVDTRSLCVATQPFTAIAAVIGSQVRQIIERSFRREWIPRQQAAGHGRACDHARFAARGSGPGGPQRCPAMSRSSHAAIVTHSVDGEV